MSYESFSPRYSGTKAFFVILFSVISISGSSLSGWLLYRHWMEIRRNDPAYRIVSIRQICPDRDQLTTEYLSQLFELSVDHPSNLFTFSLPGAQLTLSQHPVVEQAGLRKIPPDTLEISYTLRKPIAFLHNYSNTVIDAQGSLFPFHPFYTPKRLPFLRLPNLLKENREPWGLAIGGRELALAQWILSWVETHLASQGWRVGWIDLSNAWAEQQVLEEILLFLEEEEGAAFFLRLPRTGLPQAFTNFLVLYPHVSLEREARGPILVDFRIPHLAFVKEVTHETVY